MSNDKHLEQKESKSVEHQSAGAPITGAADNALQSRQEKMLASKAFRFSVDNPFTIEMGNGEKIQDRRPLRAEVTACDKSGSIRIAQAADSGERRPPLQGGISDAAAYADTNGVCPFGEALSGGVSDSKAKNTSYYSLAVGIESTSSKGLRDDLININIGDHMLVDGQPVTDGKRHHGVFPINTGSGGHFRWVEASIQMGKNGVMHITIEKLSASKEKPTTAADWNEVNLDYQAKHTKQPQHINAEQYFDAVQQGTDYPWRRDGSKYYTYVQLGREKEYKDY